MTAVTANADRLRFLTAGSVDDGKSTLIGRLLFDSKALLRDQVAALAGRRSAHLEEDELDLALVTDGLESEREQGITIDVAYRYFATPRRAFQIADAPGHEQYTRNMVTAASASDVAVLLIDASRVVGDQLKPQTRRHATIAKLLGLRVVVAINKMDLLGWSEQRFVEIREAFLRHARTIDLTPEAFVPMAARYGDNVVTRSLRAPWYDGPALIELLEGMPAPQERAAQPLRLPVQRLQRLGDGRHYQGRIESGRLSRGQEILALPSKRPARVVGVHVFGESVEEAIAGQAVAIELDRDLDLGRGDVIADLTADVTKHFDADLCWLDETAFQPGRRYLLRQGARTTQAVIEEVLYVREMTELAEVRAASGLSLNDIAAVRIRTREPLLADGYADLPATGAFILIDPLSNQTAAGGMIRDAGLERLEANLEGAGI